MTAITFKSSTPTAETSACSIASVKLTFSQTVVLNIQAVMSTQFHLSLLSLPTHATTTARGTSSRWLSETDRSSPPFDATPTMISWLTARISATKTILCTWASMLIRSEFPTYAILWKLFTLSLPFRATGKYFLETHANIFNLSKGLDGIRHTPVKVVRLLPPNNNGANRNDIPSEIEENVYF